MTYPYSKFVRVNGSFFGRNVPFDRQTPQEYKSARLCKGMWIGQNWNLHYRHSTSCAVGEIKRSRDRKEREGCVERSLTVVVA